MKALLITVCFMFTSAKETIKFIKAARDPNYEKEVTDVTATLNDDDLILEYDTVARIASLPLHCHHVEFPYKLGQVLTSESDLKTPSGKC